MAERVLLSTNGQADVTSIRQEIFSGRAYTVVPVIAIVETVVFGANSPGPEFATAQEFGKFPDSWNGRPVVLGHPKLNGIYVSANIPTVLEDYHMGFMFNTRLDSKKLKTEAWIDNVRVEEAGGEFKDMLDRVNAGEAVEVSVGIFTEVVARKGRYNQKDYEGIWTNVVPDHLALLPPGEVGACSVADGCGAPRLNSTALQPSALRTMASQASPTVAHACCDGCAHGTGCTGTTGDGPVNIAAGATANNPADPNADNNENGINPEPASPTGGLTPPGSVSTLPGSGSGETSQTRRKKLGLTTESAAASEGESDVQLTPEESAGLELLESRRSELLSELFVGAIPGEMVLDDVRCLVRQALQEMLNVAMYDFDLLALTAEKAVFYVWGDQGVFKQIGYSVASNGTVSLTGTPEPVNLLTKILPRQTADISGVNANSNHEGDVIMADQTGQGASGAAPAGGGSGQGGSPGTGAPASGTSPAAPHTEGSAGDLGEAASGNAGEGEGGGPNNNSAGGAVMRAFASVAEFLAAAPAGIREALQETVNVHSARKVALVQALTASPRNRFSEAALKEMDVPTLENLAAMAEVNSFEGRAGFALPMEGIDVSTSGSGNGMQAFARAPGGYLGKGNGANAPEPGADA